MNPADDTSRAPGFAFFAIVLPSLFCTLPPALGQEEPTLTTVQTRFGSKVDPTGDVRLTWSGDDQPATIVVRESSSRDELLTASWPDGESTTTIVELPADEVYTFRVENSSGTFLSQEEQEVIDTTDVPFELQLSVAACQSDDETEEECDIVVTGGSPGPPPGAWLLRIDEEEYVLAPQPEPEEREACEACVARFPDVESKPTFVFCDSFVVSGAGAHQFEILGYLPREQANLDYLLVGAFEAPMAILDCEADCEDDSAPMFRRGDADGNGELDVTDAINTLTFQFLGTLTPPCQDAADFDDNGEIEVTDPIASLSHQFLGTEPPAPPGKTECGVDPTPEGPELGCEQYDTCGGA